MHNLSAMIPLLAAVLIGLGLSLVDSDDARRELKRHRLVRVGELKSGAARIDGRVLPADNPTAPAGSAVAFDDGLDEQHGAVRPPVDRPGPRPEQRFLVDDGSGQALVVVRRRRPNPCPETILTTRSSARWAPVRTARTAGAAIRVGNGVSIGGYASLIVDPTGDAPSYRGPPTRFMLTATRYYPLLIVRR